MLHWKENASVRKDGREMPKVWEKSGKVYQRLWRRIGRVFCDSCGMVIKDPYYYKWTMSYVADKGQWIDLEYESHTNPTCSGYAVNMLLQSVPSASEPD
jgi:hypothetical protein